MPYDLFISYAHKDNTRGQVHDLRNEIDRDFHLFAGRKLQIFFDEHDIPSMSDWEKRIATGLRESRLFLAVISPNYIESKYCLREWEEYVRYEAMRQCLGEGVAPVYFIELPSLGSPGMEHYIDKWVQEMRKRQICDLVSPKPVKIMPWHDAGKLALKDEEVAHRLKELKEQLADRLGRADKARQSPTNIYRHNPQFVGRVHELTLLRESLNERSNVGVVGYKSGSGQAGAAAVHGIGGMGKTELALAYTHAFAWDYPGGRWLIRAENLENIDQALSQLAGPLQIEFSESEKKSLHLAGERILAELRRRERSLLLLDNVTHPSLLSPDALMRLPPQSHVHLIATTRLGPTQLAGSTQDHTFVAVDELPPEDALALIRAHQPTASFANDADEAAARKLVALLEGFTLAVETAAIYLGRHADPGTIASYLQNLPEDLLEKSNVFGGDRAVAVRRKEKLLTPILEATFKTLSKEQMHALTLAAIIPADQIALPWLQMVAGEKFPSLDTSTETSAVGEWKQLTDSLFSLRLLQSGDDVHVARIHRLTQEVLRKRAGSAIAELENALLAYIRSRVDNLADSWIYPDLHWEFSPLIACAWLWMERAHAAGPYFANQIAVPLQNLARYGEAEPLLRRDLEINEPKLGSDNADVGATLDNLGALLMSTNRLAEAEPLLRRSLTIAEKHADTNRAQYVNCLNNLAGFLLHTNRHQEAEPLLRHALAICQSDEAAHESPMALCLKNLAVLLKDTNRLEEAELLMRQGLRMDEEKLGRNHPTVAKGLHNLAQLLIITNRLAEAEPMLRRCLQINVNHLEEEHPDVATMLCTLGDLLKNTNQYAEAEQLMRQALGIFEKKFGPNHTRVADAQRILASLLESTGRLGEAKDILRQALKIYEASFGPNHTHVANVLSNLAGILKDTNRLEEAESMFLRALAIFEQSYGPNHTEVATLLNNLGGLYLLQNRLIESKPLFLRSLKINEDSLGPGHPKVATNLDHLAQWFQADNQSAKAEPLMRRALSICEKSFGPDHPQVAIRLNNLAQLLQILKKLPEAELLLYRALSIDEKSLGLNHTNVAIRLNNLTQLLLTLERYAEAEPLIRRALSIELKNLGSNHTLVATSLNNLAHLLAHTNRETEAVPLYRHALEIDEVSFGLHHPTVASDLDGLSSVLVDLHRLEEAEPLLRRALKIHEQCLGVNHPQIAGKIYSLIYMLEKANRLQEAEPLMRRAVEIILRSDPLGLRSRVERDDYIKTYMGLLQKMGLPDAQVLDKVNELTRPFGVIVSGK